MSAGPQEIEKHFNPASKPPSRDGVFWTTLRRGRERGQLQTTVLEGYFVMWRLCGLIVGLGILAAASSQSAWATSPPVGEKKHYLAPQSLIIKARQMTEKQKCRALNRCRQKYTHCENKLAAQHKLDDATLDAKCVKPYQKCINSNFSGGEWFITRWFNPSYLDCKQY